jgi:hypothetical protein
VTTDAHHFFATVTNSGVSQVYGLAGHSFAGRVDELLELVTTNLASRTLD